MGQEIPTEGQKKRGRPRKSKKSTQTTNIITKSIAPDVLKAPKKRGRPPKEIQLSFTQTDDDEDASLPNLSIAIRDLRARHANNVLDEDPSQTYNCICGDENRFEHWIACENLSCPIEWFHKNCVGILDDENPNAWTCNICNSILPSSQSQITGTDSKESSVEWLLKNISPGGKLEKEFLFKKYSEFCSAFNIKQLNDCSLGKLIFEQFSGVKNSNFKTGTNTKAKPHYKGIHFRNLNEETLSLQFSDLLSAMKSQIPTIRHCPKGARISAALALNKVLMDVCKLNSPESWQKLMTFAFICFPSKESADNTKNLTTYVKENISVFESIPENNFNHFLQDLVTKTKKKISTNEKMTVPVANKSKKVLSKLSDGDVKGAVRLLCSDDILAPQNEETFRILQEKHLEPIQNFIEAQNESTLQKKFEDIEKTGKALQTKTVEVKAAILSFPNGSAGGLDGFHPQVLKDLISSGECGEKLLTSLTSLCNLMLNGKVPISICALLYGAKLTALQKKCGGIRPIAVGSVFRRLTSKICCCFCMKNLRSYFNPIQLGFGTKHGAEIGAHSARRYYNFPFQTTKIFLKIDYKNAFNMVCREKMLAEVQDKIPEIFQYVYQCYNAHSNLYWNFNRISSQRGCQQGDPLGPALFSLTLHTLASKLKSEFNLWYLDDGTLGGDEQSVFEDLKTLIQYSKEIGLEINMTKCEIDVLGPLNNYTNILDRFEKIAPGIQPINYDNVELLGVPLNEESISNAFEKKIRKLENLSEGVKDLPSHAAYYLLKHSLAIPRIVYFLRTAPLWKHNELLASYDDLLQATLENITNCKLSSKTFMQASLPVRHGGIGIRKASTLSLPCFLASSACVHEVMQDVLPPFITTQCDFLVKEGVECWKMVSHDDLPTAMLEKIQKVWETPIIKSMQKELHDTATSMEDKALLLAAEVKESGAWLNALPSQNLGALLDNQTFRVAIALRLGCKMCVSHKCRCGVQIDEYGRHGLSCKLSAGRHSRHNIANDVIKRALISAECPASREPLGIFRSDGKRPDGLTLIPWKKGKSLLWDFTCTDTFAMSYLKSTSSSAGAAASIAEDKKLKKYQDLMPQFIFAPVAVETSGVWGQRGLKFIKEIGSRLAAITGEPRSTSFLIQHISLAVQRGNAGSIVGATSEELGLDEIFYIA